MSGPESAPLGAQDGHGARLEAVLEGRRRLRQARRGVVSAEKRLREAEQVEADAHEALAAALEAALDDYLPGAKP